MKKLLCVVCIAPKKEAELISHGFSLCKEHYNKRVDFARCVDSCGIEKANDQKHKHIKIKSEPDGE